MDAATASPEAVVDSSAAPETVTAPPAPQAPVSSPAAETAVTSPPPEAADAAPPPEAADAAPAPEAVDAAPAPEAADAAPAPEAAPDDAGLEAAAPAEAAEPIAPAADEGDESISADMPVDDEDVAKPEAAPDAESEAPSEQMQAPAAEDDGSSAPALDEEVTVAAGSVALVERPADEVPETEPHAHITEDQSPVEPESAGEDPVPAEGESEDEAEGETAAEVVVDVPVAVVDAGDEVVEAEVVEPDAAEADAEADDPVVVEVAPAAAEVPVAAEPPVDAEIIDGPVAEDVPGETDDRGEQQPPDAAAASETDQAEQATAAGGGLGWLLSMSGLGAETADPDSIPVSPAAEAPVSAVPDPEPVSAAPVRTDWFSPSAENHIVTPRGATDEPAGSGTAETEPFKEEHPEDEEQAAEKAVRAPSMQLPTLSVPPPPEPEFEPVPALPDPEQLLAAYPYEVDLVTLRETVAEPDRLRALRDRVTDRLEYAERDSVRARLLSVRAVVSRLLGEYGRALADGREALRHAEATGELGQIAVVQARLAQVQQWRGDFAEADRLYEEANSVELPGRLRAEMHVNAGKSCYEQGRYLEACNHFELALELRRVEDPDLVARTEAALDAVMARVQEAGWGPYPRSREEILQQSRPPQPASDYETGLVGYADSNGDVVIAESYADAQPFREGAAWVRRPHAAAWELIDETGTLLIDESSAYLQALPFSDGLAWVSRDPAGGWFAVDWHNRVIVPGGFDDVRPFRRGVAPVRRGGWGAIDRHGRIVVQPKYRAFATELSAGGPVDGFTEEGLAVVDAGDRFGVVDRTGQLRVPPVHARLIVHPAAFIVGDREGRWGALDRDGEPLVDVTHREPADVVQEIERKVSDTRPVL